PTLFTYHPSNHSVNTILLRRYHLFSLFFFNDTATTEIYTLSLHDALPISQNWTQFPGKETTVKRKRYSRKFQRMAVERMRTCEDSRARAGSGLGARAPGRRS